MKKLEEVLNLPPHNEFRSEDDSGEIVNEVKPAVYNDITPDEKVDHALGNISDLDEHDREMDDIAKHALEAFEELREYGMNSSEAHAGKILEVASQMLKTALEASNSKSRRKLDTVDLQLKKLKINKHYDNATKRNDPSSGEFDRNELLNLLKKPAETPPTDK